MANYERTNLAGLVRRRSVQPWHHRLGSTRIPQLTQTSWKRGAILEQRRRPTLKFQHHFGFRQVIAMKLNIPFAAPLIDICSKAQTHRLRCARIAPRAFRGSQLRNPGSIVTLRAGQVLIFYFVLCPLIGAGVSGLAINFCCSLIMLSWLTLISPCGRSRSTMT